MVVAEPIQALEYLRSSGVFPFSTKEGVLYTAESIDIVINTMHKYQKIEEIIHDDWIKGVNSGATLNKIEEVLEDGKIY